MASPNQLSFLPDDYMEKKLRRRTNAIFGVLFLLIVSAIGAALMLKERSTRQMEKQKAQLDAQLAEAAKPIEQFKQMQEKQQVLAHQAELTASLLEKVPRSYLMAELSNALPSGVSLLDFVMDSRIRVNTPAAPKTAFEQRKAEVDAQKGVVPIQVAQPRIYDVSMKLTGIASTDVQVAQFITKLNKSALLKDVNLIFSEEQTQGTDKLRRFQIEMTLDPNAQVSASDIKAQQERNAGTAAVPIENK